MKPQFFESLLDKDFTQKFQKSCNFVKFYIHLVGNFFITGFFFKHLMGVDHMMMFCWCLTCRNKI